MEQMSCITIMDIKNICNTLSQICVIENKLGLCSNLLHWKVYPGGFFLSQYGIEPHYTLIHSFKYEKREKPTCNSLEITIYVATSKNAPANYHVLERRSTQVLA